MHLLDLQLYWLIFQVFQANPIHQLYVTLVEHAEVLQVFAAAVLLQQFLVGELMWLFAKNTDHKKMFRNFEISTFLVSKFSNFDTFGVRISKFRHFLVSEFLRFLTEVLFTYQPSFLFKTFVCFFLTLFFASICIYCIVLEFPTHQQIILFMCFIQKKTKKN